MPRGKLDEEERSLIGHLEQKGWGLRNIALASIPKEESDFDLVMTPHEQNRWINNPGYVDNGGERLVDPELRRRYRGRFQRFLEMPDAEEVLDVLQAYIQAGVPALRRGEVSFWGCSCLPTNNAYSRVNINWQEVFTVYTSVNSLRFSLYLARSPLKEVFGNISERHPTLRYTNHRHGPGGQDQTNFKKQRALACGVPSSLETDVRVRDEEIGELLPPGETGELEFGPHPV